jgi:hypothetical protein
VKSISPKKRSVEKKTKEITPKKTKNIKKEKGTQKSPVLFENTSLSPIAKVKIFKKINNKKIKIKLLIKKNR